MVVQAAASVRVVAVEASEVAVLPALAGSVGRARPEERPAGSGRRPPWPADARPQLRSAQAEERLREKRWENKERGPRGPIKERFSGRMGGLYDVDEGDAAASTEAADFDDIASRADDEQE